MTKSLKHDKSPSNGLHKPKKGKISKNSKNSKLNGSSGPKKLENGKTKKAKTMDFSDLNEQVLIVKKKPAKADLKLIIEALKKDPKSIVIRKAIRYLPFYLKSTGLTKKLLAEIIRLWAEAGEKVRVVCLLCLIRIYTKLKDESLKQLIIKKLYASFLDKCRITKRETMSMIGFMRHSLVEIYKLDPQIAHKQAEISCQQLTVTLKNAYHHKNEETYKTVLNWQFANCLILLSSLIMSHEEDSPVRKLTHQVIQLNLGAMNLMSSPRYNPFYCHLIDNLINISQSTSIFIPIIPLILNIIEKIHLKKETKKPKKQTGSDGEELSDDEEEEEEKVYNMDLLNHVSLDEAHNDNYHTAVLNRLYILLVRYLASQCHRIAFPELVLLPCVQLKKWTKKNNDERVQVFKSLLDKIKADVSLIEESRKNVDFAFTDYSAVDAWEKRMSDSSKLAFKRLERQSHDNKDDL